MSNRAGLFEMSMPDDDQHMLKLCKVKSSDVGPLIFTASNPYGTDSCLLTLELAGRQATATHTGHILLCCKCAFLCCKGVLFLRNAMIFIRIIFISDLFTVLSHSGSVCVTLFPVAPTFESIMEDLDVSVGETPRFAVVVEGRPIPDILWYKVCYLCLFGIFFPPNM